MIKADRVYTSSFFNVVIALLLIGVESFLAIPAYSVYPSFHTISTLDTNSGGRESLLVRRKTLYFVYCNRIIPFSIV